MPSVYLPTTTRASAKVTARRGRRLRHARAAPPLGHGQLTVPWGRPKVSPPDEAETFGRGRGRSGDRPPTAGVPDCATHRPRGGCRFLSAPHAARQFAALGPSGSPYGGFSPGVVHDLPRGEELAIR